MTPRELTEKRNLVRAICAVCYPKGCPDNKAADAMVKILDVYLTRFASEITADESLLDAVGDVLEATLSADHEDLTEAVEKLRGPYAAAIKAAGRGTSRLDYCQEMRAVDAERVWDELVKHEQDQLDLCADNLGVQREIWFDDFLCVTKSELAAAIKAAGGGK